MHQDSGQHFAFTAKTEVLQLVGSPCKTFFAGNK